MRKAIRPRGKIQQLMDTVGDKEEEASKSTEEEPKFKSDNTKAPPTP
jgi:hypothetical protein